MRKYNSDNVSPEFKTQVLKHINDLNLFNHSPRDPARIERILALISQVWTNNPDLRLTQLILNVIPGKQDAYYIEDDILEKQIKKFYMKGKK